MSTGLVPRSPSLVPGACILGLVVLIGAPLAAQVSPTFIFEIPSIASPYDITTGIGTVEGTIRIQEDPPAAGGAGTPTLAFTTAVRHDPTLLAPIGWSFSPEMYAVLPGLAAIDVFPSLSDTGDGLAIGLLFDLAGVPALAFPFETEVVTFEYVTVPGVLAGNPVGTTTLLSFDDGMTFGGETVVNAMYHALGPIFPFLEDGVVTLTPLTIGTDFVRGDVNADSLVQVSDVVAGLTYLLTFGGPAPLCLDAVDANDDGQLDIADPITVLLALFVPGTPPLPAPYPLCGPDPSPDGFFGPACGGPVGCP